MSQTSIESRPKHTHGKQFKIHRLNEIKEHNYSDVSQSILVLFTLYFAKIIGKNENGSDPPPNTHMYTHTHTNTISDQILIIYTT